MPENNNTNLKETVIPKNETTINQTVEKPKDNPGPNQQKSENPKTQSKKSTETQQKPQTQKPPKQSSGILQTIGSIIGSILYFPITLFSYIFSFFPKIF
jgi:hypothetical protein